MIGWIFGELSKIHLNLLLVCYKLAWFWSGEENIVNKLLGTDGESAACSTDLTISRQDSLDVSQVQQRFEPRDLKALLKNLDKEIDSTDTLLQDEVEKRKKYQVSSSI